MGTRSNIAIQQPDGVISAIYCHWDGYPDHVGKTLRDHYASDEQAKALIALGSISSLNERIAPNEGEAHSFDNAADGVTVAYHRDRGEKLQPARNHANEPEWFAAAQTDSGAEYCYLWRDGKWLCWDMYEKLPHDLYVESAEEA